MHTLTAHRYQLIPRTLIFLFNEAGEVLLLHRPDNAKVFPGLYNGIGGHVEQGEDLLTSAERELMEEVGISCGQLALCALVVVDSGTNPGVGIAVFKGFSDKRDVLDLGSGKPEWVDLREAVGLPLVEDLYELLPLVAGWTMGDPVQLGFYQYQGAQLSIRFTTQTL